MAHHTAECSENEGEEEMKKLREQRQGEDDNVLSFPQPELATSPKPPGGDWLRSLPNGCRFVCRSKQLKQVFMPWFGIAAILDKVILLGMDHEFQPGHVQFKYVDSVIFSGQNELVQVLPDMKEEEGLPP